jgi:hypothetical protein
MMKIRTLRGGAHVSWAGYRLRGYRLRRSQGVLQVVCEEQAEEVDEQTGCWETSSVSGRRRRRAAAERGTYRLEIPEMSEA